MSTQFKAAVDHRFQVFGCGADLRHFPAPVAQGQPKQIDEHLAWQAEQFRQGEEAMRGVI